MVGLVARLKTTSPQRRDFLAEAIRKASGHDDPSLLHVAVRGLAASGFKSEAIQALRGLEQNSSHLPASLLEAVARELRFLSR